MMIAQSRTRLCADHMPDAAEDERVAVAHNRVFDLQSTANSSPVVTMFQPARPPLRNVPLGHRPLHHGYCWEAHES